jgi:hypothetical protein
MLIGYFADGDARVALIGVGLLCAIAAAYCMLDVLLFTRSNDLLDVGETPSFTPLPPSPVTLVHDPNSKPRVSPEGVQRHGPAAKARSSPESPNDI